MKSIRASCCGKKRKPTQLVYFAGFEYGVFRCKDGFGCKKKKDPPSDKNDQSMYYSQCVNTK
jgi:hypothetical protein